MAERRDTRNQTNTGSTGDRQGNLQNPSGTPLAGNTEGQQKANEARVQAATGTPFPGTEGQQKANQVRAQAATGTGKFSSSTFGSPAIQGGMPQGRLGAQGMQDLHQVLDSVDFPTTKQDIIRQVGEQRVQIQGREVPLQEALARVPKDRFVDASEVVREVHHLPEYRSGNVGTRATSSTTEGFQTGSPPRGSGEQGRRT